MPELNNPSAGLGGSGNPPSGVSGAGIGGSMLYPSAGSVNSVGSGGGGGGGGFGDDGRIHVHKASDGFVSFVHCGL